MNCKLFPKPFLFLALILAFITACKEEIDISIAPDATAFNADVVVQWNDLILEVERFTPGYLPPVAGRAYGHIGLAIYETAVHGMPGYRSLGNHYDGLQLPPAVFSEEIHYPIAVNEAYATMMQKLFPTAPAAQLSQIETLRNSINQSFAASVAPAVYNASVEWGRSVATAVYAWSQTDPLGHEGYLRPFDPAYQPPSGPGLWQPTYPDFGNPLLPHWGDVRTFAARPDDKVADPLPFSTDASSEFYVQALETHNKVNLIKQGLNYEDKWIAQFWSDDCPALTFSPAGRWIAIATQAIEHIDADLAKAIVVTAKTGMAVCDAGIRCWDEKYRFNLLRPVDYIRGVMGHSDWNTIMCPDGAGQYYTPQFPTYPSGHGTFGAAAAEVLTAEFGNNFQMTDRCHEDRTDFLGTPRTFYSFYHMAQENAYSRLPIGVHFRMDSDAALDLGFKVGRHVNNLPWRG